MLSLGQLDAVLTRAMHQPSGPRKRWGFLCLQCRGADIVPSHGCAGI